MAFKIETEAWYNQLEYAELRGCSKATLEAERSRGGGVPYSRIGKRVFYLGSDIEQFLLSQRRRSASDKPGLPGRVPPPYHGPIPENEPVPV